MTDTVRPRFFYIANPDTDDVPEPRTPALAAARPPHPIRPLPAAHVPAPLTTNLPSHTSNPTLSSPSTTSSPAVESTPPPSTPGLAPDLLADAPHPAIAPADTPTSRTGAFYGKIKHWTRPSLHSRSPTSSVDTFTSPTSQSTRSTLPDRVNIQVTTDSDNYQRVDITGFKSPDYIRERIFTKLRIADEDQANFSIYRTEMGGYAQGDALSPDTLFDLCKQLGDREATLKFFVSHSSAPVHDLASSASLSPTVNTIPPPVLPYYSYGPLRPRRRSGSRHGSVSSASERIQHEAAAAAGYEASVSDDLDNADRETNRSTLRPAPQAISITHSNPPSSPTTSRRPIVPFPHPLSSSPNSTLSPDRARNQYRQQHHHPASLSPNRPAFDDQSLTPPARSSPFHIRSGSDAAAEREHALQASESQLQHADRQWGHREERGKPTRRLPPHRERERTQPAEADDSPARDWVMVGHDVPVRERISTPQQEAPRSSPIGLSRRQRDPTHSPVHYPNGPKRPVIPTPPRNPPPAAPARPGQPVHPSWAVTWKLPEKEPKPSPTPQTALTRLTAKSMENMRIAYQLPPSLQPGGRAHKLPITRPSTSNLRESSSMYTSGEQKREAGGGTNLSSLGKPYAPDTAGRVHPLPRPPGMQAPSQSTSDFTSQPFGAPPIYSSESSNGSVYPSLGSPNRDPFPRPQSAFGDIIAPSAPFAARKQTHSPAFGRNDVEDVDSLRSPRALSPSHLGTARKDDGPSPLFGLKVSLSNAEQHNIDAQRTPPRSPVSPLSPRRDRHSGLSDSTSSSTTPDTLRPSPSSRSTEDSTGTGGTLRPEEHGYLARMIDSRVTESDTTSTLMPRATERSNSGRGITPLPPIPVQPSVPPPPPPPVSHLSSQADVISISSSRHSEDVDDDDDDDDDDDSDENGTLWTVPMAQNTTSPRPKSILKGRQHLTIQTGNAGATAGRSSATGTHPLPPNFPPPPSIPPPPPPQPQRRPVHATSKSRKSGNRESTFSERTDSTWATRPPAEDLYERLEDVFPEHDLDKPVIDSSSGGTSPTTAEHTVMPPPIGVSDKSRVKGKKSIRIVAEEHKKKIDRSSRSDSSTMASVLRKRSTKLWGSKVEEVPIESAKGTLASSLPDSPYGGPKPIFKWVRGELIGKGTYGRVYLALNATTGEMIAVKQVEIPTTASDKSDSRQLTVVEALKLESETLKDLDHPNIVQYLGFEETPRFLSIFLEYVPGGSIGSCLRKHGKFDQDVTKSFTSQILQGLEYLHSKGILHRDLKADNILVETSGVCKISDFGISKRTDDINRNGNTAMQGSVFWMAPEVMKKGYNSKIDIWSVGCVVLEMWAGERPWSEEEAVAVMMKLYQDKTPPPVPKDISLSSAALDFRNKCFMTNPEERPTAAELRKHPYLILPQDWIFNGFK